MDISQLSVQMQIEEWAVCIENQQFFFVFFSFVASAILNSGLISLHFQFSWFRKIFPSQQNKKKKAENLLWRFKRWKWIVWRSWLHLEWLNWKWTDTGPALHYSVLGMTVSSPCPAMQVSLDMHTKPEEWTSSSFLKWGISNWDLMEIDHELFNKGSLV